MARPESALAPAGLVDQLDVQGEAEIRFVVAVSNRGVIIATRRTKLYKRSGRQVDLQDQAGPARRDPLNVGHLEMRLPCLADPADPNQVRTQEAVLQPVFFHTR